MAINSHLHIISFDIPFPANYGGVIDVFYKIKALSQQGIGIHLHCFEYGRSQSDLLHQFCESVHYYPRKKILESLPFDLPYIIKSRFNQSLLTRLLSDDYPILFEGLHSCFFLGNPALKNRLKLVRMHNIEWQYYHHLYLTESRFFKKMYFKIEAFQLQKFERQLQFANHILAISPNDFTYLNQHFGTKNKATDIHYLPAFHTNEKVTSLLGKGDYALYHGNLEVNENHQAAIFLIEKVFKNTKIPLIIAGKNPQKNLLKSVAKYTNIQLILEPDDAQLDQLLSNAQVNILPTFQATGIKLKLLNALFKGRFCLVNTPMIDHTGLEKLCYVADSPEAFKIKLNDLLKKDFTKDILKERKEILEQSFSNQKNSLTLTKLLPQNQMT